MRPVALCLALAVPAGWCAAGRAYELNGRIVPESQASVSLFGATTPFHTDALADSRGHFRFRGVEAGEYTIAVFIPGRGEARRTVEIGPSTADRKGRVEITIQVEGSSALSAESLRETATVSARQLAVPESARREYAEAQKKLARRETDAAISHLEKAVEIAPQFAEAWNNLGTIAYQTGNFARAESCFRKGLDQGPGAFEPLVNLGGVLLTEGQPDDALKYNKYAVLSRPNDALANSQLGMNYFALGNLDLALKYLETARRIDPAHFSYPQLTLAQIHIRRDEPAAAAEELRDFLKRHPDAPQAAGVRAELKKLVR